MNYDLNKSVPSPQRTIVTGIVDEMKFSREQVILTTADNKKIVVGVAKDFFRELKEYFGQEIAIQGMAYFKPGGHLSYVKMESLGNADKAAKMFSKKPHKMTVQQQIALQLREGKKRNPLDEIAGKWPGEESLEELMDFLNDLN